MAETNANTQNSVGVPVGNRVNEIPKPIHTPTPLTPKQQVITPLPELDIDLDPTTRQKAFVGRDISRVWATLWGETGSGLKRVSVDSQGRLNVGVVNQVNGVGVGYFTDTGLADGSINKDLGAEYNWVRVICLGDLTLGKECDSGYVAYATNFFTPISLDAFSGVMVSIFEVFRPVRYLQFTDIGSLNFEVHGVYGSI